LTEIPLIEPVNNEIYADPEMERDVYEAPRSLAGFNPESDDIFQMLKSMQGANGQPPFGQSQPKPPPVPIVLLALFVYALFAANLEWLVGGAVFSSLVVWEIFEFFVTTFVIRQPQQPGGIINVLFAFGGVSQEKAQIILKLLGLTNKVLRDIAIFMFTFVLLHLAWCYLVLGEGLSEILDKDFSNLLRRDEL
jgi:hypothetical protein